MADLLARIERPVRILEDDLDLYDLSVRLVARLVTDDIDTADA
jgi:hypothetical protein